MRRVSGPLLDRIDLRVVMPRMEAGRARRGGPAREQRRGGGAHPAGLAPQPGAQRRPRQRPPARSSAAGGLRPGAPRPGMPCSRWRAASSSRRAASIASCAWRAPSPTSVSRSASDGTRSWRRPRCVTAPWTRGWQHDAAAGMTSERDAWIALASTPGVGPVTFERLLAAFGDARRTLEAVAALAASDAEAALARRLGTRLRPGLAAAIRSAAARPGPHRPPDGGPGWLDAHAARRRLPGAAPRARGPAAGPLRHRRPGLPEPASGSSPSSGTRRPTGRGPGPRGTDRRIASPRPARWSSPGWRSASTARPTGAPWRRAVETIAVIGSGLDEPGPLGNRRLARAIVGAGAIVSELAPGVRATAGTYPRRNRIISVLASATIVVEAPARSGALITARHALEQGRQLLVAPGRPLDPAVAGNLALLRETPARPLVGPRRDDRGPRAGRRCGPARRHRPRGQLSADSALELPGGSGAGRGRGAVRGAADSGRARACQRTATRRRRSRPDAPPAARLGAGPRRAPAGGRAAPPCAAHRGRLRWLAVSARREALAAGIVGWRDDPQRRPAPPRRAAHEGGHRVAAHGGGRRPPVHEPAHDGGSQAALHGVPRLGLPRPLQHHPLHRDPTRFDRQGRARRGPAAPSGAAAGGGRERARRRPRHHHAAALHEPAERAPEDEAIEHLEPDAELLRRIREA